MAQVSTSRTSGLVELERYISENFKLVSAGQKREIVFSNERKDSFSINLAEENGYPLYEIELNGRSFRLYGSDYRTLINKFNLPTKLDAQDSVKLSVRGKDVLDQSYSSVFAFVFSTAERLFRFDPLPGAALTPKEQSVWAYVQRSLETEPAARLPVNKLPNIPRELQEVFKNAALVYGGSGAVVQLPDSRLAVITARHVYHEDDRSRRARGISVDGIGIVGMKGIVSPKPPEEDSACDSNDLAIIPLSSEEATRLRAKGVRGLPLADSIESTKRFARAISIGYGDDLSTQQDDLSLTKTLQLISGRVFTVPKQNTDQCITGPEPLLSEGAKANATNLASNIMSSSLYLRSADSGGPLLVLNSKTNQFEVVAVNVATERFALGGGFSVSTSARSFGGSSLHSRVDKVRVVEWLRDYEK